MIAKLQRMLHPLSGYHWKQGSESSDTTGGMSGTTTDERFQSEDFEKLLGSASDWFTAGGIGDTGAKDTEKEELLKQMQQGYSGMISGEMDTTARDNLLAAQSDAANRNLAKQTSAISQQANMMGGAGGSRQSIAEGIAAGESAAALQGQQAQTLSDFERQRMARQSEGLAGLGSVFGGYGDFRSSQERAGESLGIFRDLISGSMGGTTTQEQEQWGKQEGESSGIMLSDKRSKKNIEKVGDVKIKDDGESVGLYEFEYKKSEGKDLPKGKQVGVMAQEVEKVKPSAVKEGEITDSKGKKKKRKKVNYGALSQ